MKPAAFAAFFARARSQFKSFYAPLTLVLLTGFWCFYQSLSHYLPFDWPWDMDLMTVNDTLLINSGQLPLHVDHPKFGMHLAMSLALRIGHFLQLVSVGDFSELRMSPSPLLCIAELTQFLRSFEAGICWLMLLLAALLLWRLFPRDPWLHLLGLLLMGFQTGLIYPSLVMRTETFSVLWLLIGMLWFCWLYQRSQARGQPGLEILAWLGGGLGCGLAIITKLQAIQSLPLFWLLAVFLYLRDSAPAATPAPLPPKRMLLALSLSMAIWAALGWLAWRSPSFVGQPPTLVPLQELAAGHLSPAQLLPDLKLQLAWLLLVTAVLLSPLLARFCPPSPLERLLSLLPLFWIGLVLAFFTPLITYLGQAQSLQLGWKLMLQDVQAVLWTNTNASTSFTAGAAGSNLAFVYNTHRGFLLLILGVPVLGVYLLGRLNKAERKLQLAALGSFCAGAPLLLLCSRPVHRDTIWFEFLGSLSALLLLHQSWASYKSQRLFQSLLMLCLLGSIGSSAGQLPWTLDQLSLYFSKFLVLKNRPLVTALYSQPGMDYPEIILNAYTHQIYPPDESKRDLLRMAVTQARGFAELKHQVRLHFIGQQPPVRALGLAEIGFPAWSKADVWSRFEQLAPELRGSLLIDPAAIARSQPAQAAGELMPIWSSDSLLCISASDYQQLFQLKPERAAPISLRQGQTRLEYYPIELTGDYDIQLKTQQTQIIYYHRFPLAWLARLQHPPFFLLHGGGGWGPEYPSWSNLQQLLTPENQPEPAARP